MKETAGGQIGRVNPRIYAEIPHADRKTALEITEELWRRTELTRLKHRESHYMNLPPWLQDQMKPVVSKHMSPRQKMILEQRQKAEADVGFFGEARSSSRMESVRALLIWDLLYLSDLSA